VRSGRKAVGVSLVAVTLAFGLGFALDASAGRAVRIDVGNNLDGSGQSWNTINAVDVSTDLNSLAVSIGFTIDFGNGQTYDTLFINENGFVSFANAPDLPVEFNPATTDLTTLGGNVIAPYYANLTSADVSGPISSFQDGFNTPTVSSSTGQIDLAADGDFSTPAGPTVPAFRVTWFDVGIPGYTNGNGDAFNQGTIQLVLFDTDGAAGNNFDLEFNYLLSNPPTPLAAGFVLGSNVLNYGDGPFDGGPGDTYHFCGGTLQATACTATTPPTSVPEPSALTLFGAGLLALVSATAFRRRSAPQLSR
jgi:hypothetical protein